MAFEELAGMTQVLCREGPVSKLEVSGVEVLSGDLDGRFGPTPFQHHSGGADQSDETEQGKGRGQGGFAPAPAPNSFGNADGLGANRLIAQKTLQLIGQFLRRSTPSVGFF